MLETPCSLPDNHNDDEYQCDRVGESRQDAHAVVPERFASIGESFRLRHRKPGQAKREDIGNYMSGIGEQGKGICNKTAGKFCYKNEHGQKKSQAQAPFGHAVGMIMPCMYTIHTISIPDLPGRGQARPWSPRENSLALMCAAC